MGNAIVVVCNEKINDRRRHCVPQAAKSFSQLIGIDLSAAVPIVSVENDLDSTMKNRNKSHVDDRWMGKNSRSSTEVDKSYFIFHFSFFLSLFLLCLPLNYFSFNGLEKLTINSTKFLIDIPFL